MNEQELIERMAEELSMADVLELRIAPLEAFRLAGLLQLATRHPAISEDNRRAALWFVAHVKAHLAEFGALTHVLQMGDDPRHDKFRDVG